MCFFLLLAYAAVTFALYFSCSCTSCQCMYIFFSLCLFACVDVFLLLAIMVTMAATQVTNTHDPCICINGSITFKTHLIATVRTFSTHLWFSGMNFFMSAKWKLRIYEKSIHSQSYSLALECTYSTQFNTNE